MQYDKWTILSSDRTLLKYPSNFNKKKKKQQKQIVSFVSYSILEQTASSLFYAITYRLKSIKRNK